MNQKQFLDVLLGFHVFTGCETVSAFAGHRKIRAIKLMAKTANFIIIFVGLVKSFQLSEELLNKLQTIVCEMYGKEIENALQTILYKERKV